MLNEWDNLSFDPYTDDFKEFWLPHLKGPFQMGSREKRRSKRVCFLWFSVDFSNVPSTGVLFVFCGFNPWFPGDWLFVAFEMSSNESNVKELIMSFLHACFFYNTQHILCGVECVRVVFSWLYWESPIKSVSFSYFHNRKKNCHLLLPSIIRHRVLTFNSVA